jgi:hypothetical protein
LEKDFFVMVVIGNANYLTWPQHGAADGHGLSQFHSWCLIASTLLATDKTPYIISTSDKGAGGYGRKWIQKAQETSSTSRPA